MTDTLGPYELMRLIGRGGMGEVHQARDTRLERTVALKLLPADLADDPERRGRFLREARAAAALNHPNITTILDIGEEGGRDYIAQEFLDGRPLSEVIAERTLPLAELAALAVPLADALAYAHEQGVIHRDLKAANVIVTKRGDPKLLDFGLAKVLREGAGGAGGGKGARADEPSTTLTLSGAVFGTPGAMSPEQALGKTVDARADVFSFGGLLYEMASGKPAFLGTTVQETLDKVLHAEPEPLGKLRRDLPSDFLAIVSKALRKDPAQRYQGMAELAADLRHFKSQTDSGLVPPAGARPPAVPRGLVVVLAAAVLLAAAWWIVDLSRASDDAVPSAADPSSPSASPSSSSPTGAPLVSVMGFENLSDPEDEAALGRMLASLVSTDLAEHGGVRVVSTAKVLASLEEVKQGGGGRFESVTAIRAARATGASVMLVGQILRRGTGVLLTAELVDVESGETRGSMTEEAPSPEEVFALAGDLADSVRRHLDVQGVVPGFDLSRSLTDSPEAYRHYNAGELAMHQRDFGLAQTFFERALDLDPTFAMAWFRLGMAHSWKLKDATPAFEQALAHGDRLSDRWRVICEAAAARSRDADDDKAYELLEPLIETGTDIPEAYNEFGELLTHSNRYWDPTRSRQCFARALELDPTYEIVLYHLVTQTIMAGDLPGARALVERAARSGEAPYGELSLLLAEHRYADAVAAAQRQIAENGHTDWEEYVIAARKLGDLELNARALEAWVTASGAERRGQAEEAALAAYLRGRFDAIPEDQFNAAMAYGTGDLEAAIAAARAGIDEAPYLFDHWFWLGLSQLRAGRPEEAGRTLAEARATLERSRNKIGPGTLDALEAVLVAAAGDARRAHEVLDRARSRPTEQRRITLETLATALVHEEEGDVAAALAAWREILEPGSLRHTYTLDLDVWPLYEIGRLEHDHGDPAAARDALTRFLDPWGDADRELASVEDARRRLAQLDAR